VGVGLGLFEGVGLIVKLEVGLKLGVAVKLDVGLDV
jgi:hypothetical protein